MTEGLKLADLIREQRRRLGSIRRLAERLGVTDKTVQDWMKKDEDELRRLRPDHIDKILEVAQDLQLEPERFSIGPPLWDPKDSYDENLAWVPPPAPRPARPFLNHAIEFLGRRVNSPIGVSPSPLTATAARITFFADQGADIITYKTVRSREARAHRPPNMYFCAADLPMLSPPVLSNSEVVVSDSYRRDLARYGVVNSFGCPSVTPEAWQADFRVAQQSARPGQLIILSVTGWRGDNPSERAAVDDWVRVLELAASAGARVIEIDLSYPTVPEASANLFHDSALVAKICKLQQRIDASVKILLKIGYLVGEELSTLVLRTAGAGLCHGFSAISALPVRAVHLGPDGAEPAFGTPRIGVGLAGRPILTLGLQCVHELALIRDREGLKEMAIVGMGGITTEQDFLAYLHSGANIVQVTSACFFDSYFPYKLRKFYDAQVRRSVGLLEEEQDIALANFAKASRSLEQELGASPDNAEPIMAAAQNEMVQWLRRKDHATSLGPLRPRPAPTMDECKRLIQSRLVRAAT